MKRLAEPNFQFEFTVDSQDDAHDKLDEESLPQWAVDWFREAIEACPDERRLTVKGEHKGTQAPAEGPSTLTMSVEIGEPVPSPDIA